ncbi:MAG: HD domain-containing protein [Acidobacteriaceae bacterium]
MTLAMFQPFDQLAAKLLDTSTNDEDGAHDLSHIVRVWRNVQLIHRDEGGDLEVLAAAVLLHDCVQVAKDSPLHSRASMLAANEARVRLGALEWEPSRIDTVAWAIESHSFSAGVAPTSIEGCILQDADRLDAIGFGGIARCFYTAGRLGSRLYDLADPEGTSRALDDGRNALDHFPKKLLTLEGTFKTRTGQDLARERHHRVLEFYRGMLAEVKGQPR